MGDPHNIPNFQGPRLPSEESREAEIDPEKFRRISKVEETDESQQQKKKGAKKEVDESEEEEAAEETQAPTTSFASFMSDEKSDSDLNVGKSKTNVRRPQSDVRENTQMMKGPRTSYSSQFMGKDKGEELGDEMFNNLEEAPPEYSQEDDIPTPSAPSQSSQTSQSSQASQQQTPPPPSSSETQQTPVQNTQDPNNQNVTQQEPVQETQEVKEPQKSETSDQKKQDDTSTKKPEAKEDKKKKLTGDQHPLDLEAHIEPPKTDEIPPHNEELAAEETSLQKTPHNDEQHPSKEIKTEDQTDKLQKVPEQLQSEDHPHDTKDEYHPTKDDDSLSTTNSHGEHQEDSNTHDTKETHTQAHKEHHEKTATNNPDLAAALEGEQIVRPIKGSFPTDDEDEIPAGAQTTSTSSKRSSKRVISQPDTPVLYTSDGEVRTSLSKDHDKEGSDDADQQAAQLQVEAPVQINAPTPTQAPAYSKLHPEVFELFEKMVGLMTIESSKGKSTTTVTLNMPNSVFDKANIVLEHFETAPNQFNLQLQGSNEAVNMFSANMAELAAAFEGSKLSFQVNIRRPELSEKHRTAFHRKSTDYEGGSENKDK